MKDISRTYQEFEIFQDEENMQLLCSVMLVWCRESLEYRQGKS